MEEHWTVVSQRIIDIKPLSRGRDDTGKDCF